MKKLMRRILRTVFLWIPMAFVTLSVLWVVLLKWVPVNVTPLMLKRAVEFRDDETYERKHEWVPLAEISPEMMKAVMTSEDNLFPKHNGFDRKAIQAALDERKAGKRVRGGSTISQQTAKNVFTFCGRTWWRKAFETYYTFLIEKLWGKERIMEVYLNVIEMGKGVYGVQAASQTFYRKDASRLSRREACTIAACLPQPLRRNAARPGPYVQKHSADLARRIPQIIYPDWVNHK